MLKYILFALVPVCLAASYGLNAAADDPCERLLNSKLAKVGYEKTTSNKTYIQRDQAAYMTTLKKIETDYTEALRNLPKVGGTPAPAAKTALTNDWRKKRSEVAQKFSAIPMDAEVGDFEEMYDYTAGQNPKRVARTYSKDHKLVAFMTSYKGKDELVRVDDNCQVKSVLVKMKESESGDLTIKVGAQLCTDIKQAEVLYNKVAKDDAPISIADGASSLGQPTSGEQLEKFLTARDSAFDFQDSGWATVKGVCAEYNMAPNVAASGPRAPAKGATVAPVVTPGGTGSR